MLNKQISFLNCMFTQPAAKILFFRQTWILGETFTPKWEYWVEQITQECIYAVTTRISMHWGWRSSLEYRVHARNWQPVADPATRFYGQFADCMEMYASAQTVAEYLKAHRGWFCRCAAPMKVEPQEKMVMLLTIGRLALWLWSRTKNWLGVTPPDQGVYCIKTPFHQITLLQGMKRRLKSAMELVEAVPSNQDSGKVTRVEWQIWQFMFSFPSLSSGCPNLWFKAPAIAFKSNRAPSLVAWLKGARRFSYLLGHCFHSSQRNGKRLVYERL